MITIINLIKGICRYKNEERSRCESGGGEASEFIHHETGEGKTPHLQVVQGSLGSGQPQGPSAFWVVTSRPGLHRSCCGRSSNPFLLCSSLIPVSPVLPSFPPTQLQVPESQQAGHPPKKPGYSLLACLRPPVLWVKSWKASSGRRRTEAPRAEQQMKAHPWRQVGPLPPSGFPFIPLDWLEVPVCPPPLPTTRRG